MADKREKLIPEIVVGICEKYFDQKVDKVTAPGGKSRESVRVHFADRTIIATQRAYPGRMRLEVEVLNRLAAFGAPVPKLLGETERVFFQEDVGSNRLSGALAQTKGDSQTDIAASAFKSILQIQEAGQKSGLSEIVPPLGHRVAWVAGLVNAPGVTAEKYGIAPPVLAYQPLTKRLHVHANRFVKWDARPGNASIRTGGQVYWFDWEHCGRRQGMEDFAWLAGDEFFPLDADNVVAILTAILPGGRKTRDLNYLGHFIVFHIIQRLAIIHRRFSEVGWTDPQKAMRYDLIGVDRALAVRLCTHGAGWAGRAKLTRPLEGWFESCARAIKAM